MNKYEKLLAVQSELKAPKGQYNSFGKYKYRSCEDILEAVKPVLAKHNATVFITDEIKVIGDRYYTEATAHFVDCESEGEIIVTASAREEAEKKGMDGSQVTGASSSYARKYALNGLFAIDDTKDSDYTNDGGNGGKQTTKAKAEAPKAEAPKTEETKAETVKHNPGLLDPVIQQALPKVCAICGKPIEPYVRGGKTYDVDWHCKKTIERYGEIRCIDCIEKAAKEARKDA